MTDPIIKTLEVTCDAATAFDVFVNRITAWWPLDGHSASAASGNAARGVTLEPRVGGAFFETMHDGNRNEWGEVLEYEPGRKLATTWHPGNNKDAPTRLEVTFEDLPGGRAKVTLVHSGWEIWGEAADEMRANYDEGWNFVFGDRYAGGCSEG